MKKQLFLVLAFITLLVIAYACRSKSEQTSVDHLVMADIKLDKVKEESADTKVKSSVKFVPPVIKEDREYKGEDKADAYDDGSDVKDNNIIDENNNIIKKIDKKKIIKDGDISIKVNDVVKVKRMIDSLIRKFNAYYEKEEFENNSATVSYNLKIRIPADNFENFLPYIENGTGEVKTKNINARDVTEEYVDIETRLNNKKLYLKRYNDLLHKAVSVKDIINIEENVRNIQEEIESKEGRLKYLNDQVAFSTLDLNIYKEKEITSQPQKQITFLDRLKNSVVNGWDGVVNFFLLIIQNWAILLVLLVILFLLRRYLKKRKNTK